RSTLSLLMSRCTMPCACRCCKPLHVCRASVSRVHATECHQSLSTYLFANRRNLRLRDFRVVVYNVDERSALHIVHHYPEHSILVEQERVEEIDDVGVPALLHD